MLARECKVKFYPVIEFQLTLIPCVRQPTRVTNNLKNYISSYVPLVSVNTFFFKAFDRVLGQLCIYFVCTLLHTVTEHTYLYVYIQF